MLQRWGPVYLSREEYERRITMALSRYVGALAARVRNVRDPEFRRHQAGELRRITAGGGFGPVTLARGALRGAHRRGARTPA